MIITNITIKFINDRSVLAYCTVIVDNCFAIRDIKIIQGRERIFMSFPCRKIKYKCQQCSQKIPFDSKFCMFCGRPFAIPADGILKDMKGQTVQYLDQALPINHECRKYFEETVLAEYNRLKAVTNPF